MNMLSFRFIVIPLFLVCITTLSCSSDDNNNQDGHGEQIINQIENNLTTGNWRITKFIDSDEDETQHFAGYDFTFNSNGALTAANGSNSYEGTWSITNSDNSDNDDDSYNDLDFNIQFNLSNEFEDLNDDWDILNHSSTKIELIDISGGNGGTDYLTFERN